MSRSSRLGSGDIPGLSPEATPEEQRTPVKHLRHPRRCPLRTKNTTPSRVFRAYTSHQLGDGGSKHEAWREQRRMKTWTFAQPSTAFTKQASNPQNSSSLNGNPLPPLATPRSRAGQTRRARGGRPGRATCAGRTTRLKAASKRSGEQRNAPSQQRLQKRLESAKEQAKRRAKEHTQPAAAPVRRSRSPPEAMHAPRLTRPPSSCAARVP